ncbi:MAG: hypothetical protein K0R26_2380 [Bacteroidota bacterium]|jgi:hypothetical protein|nr:hypothetical protein [Bacteroidota bacterium]
MKAFLFSISFIISFGCYSQWDTNPANGTPIAVVSKSQDNCHVAPDTQGGALIAWDDNRNSSTSGSDIYAQRMRRSGLEKWTLNGLAVCTNSATQKSSAITNTADGSAIITWEDNRAGNYDIYAQKIDSSGNVLWTLNGIAVCAKLNNQKNPKITPDNSGGAIIVWEDSVNNYWDIYAQRISSSGSLMWITGGVAVCNAINEQNNPKIDVDGVGGAVITWQDKRNNSHYDIYTQRLDNSGTAMWTPNGLAVCTAVNTQNNPRIEPDGAGGALVAWTDKRNATDNNIYAQHINASGVSQWNGNGLLICGAANNQSALDIKYLSGTGLFLTWKDERSSVNAVFAQIVSMAGVNQLAANGILLSGAMKAINPNVISDGNGGAIVAWQDSVPNGWDIKSQRLNSSGALLWTAGGVIVSNAPDDQVNPSQVSDGNGGAIFVWEDHRNGTNFDIYSNRLYSNGTPLVGIKEYSANLKFTSVCYPNPVDGLSQIQIPDEYTDWKIEVFSLTGELIREAIMKEGKSFSIHSSEYAPGYYSYQIKINEQPVSKGNFILHH